MMDPCLKASCAVVAAAATSADVAAAFGASDAVAATVAVASFAFAAMWGKHRVEVVAAAYIATADREPLADAVLPMRELDGRNQSASFA